MPLRHCLKISDLTKEEILAVLAKSIDLKHNKEKYAHVMDGRTLLMLFQKPSLRTRVSFEVGMTQMGGHAIHYSIADSPLGVKETYGDTGKVLSRFADIVMARVNKRNDVRQLAANSTIPIINALDDFAHPCQMLADMQAIMEKKGCLQKIKMAYCGDIHNNVTYDLMRSAAVVGFEIRVAGPRGEGFEVEPEVLEECATLCAKSGGRVIVCETAVEAVTGVDVVYADSWMSYGIPKEAEEARRRMFLPFQVTAELMTHAKPDAIFMNCLPAMRGAEMTAEVIDGPQSIVFDEAENRLHTCKALMLFLLGIGGFEPTPCVCTCPSAAKPARMGKILIALGGNALMKSGQKGTYEEQMENAMVTCHQLVKLIKRGYDLVITHGNGPQVGAIKLQNQIAADKVPEMNLNVCGAESQGFLGYLLQQCLQNIFLAEGIHKDVATIVTQVVVGSEDPAFRNPTKPIGRFFTAQEAEVLRAQGKTVVEDSGRGYRVVVPSPMPLEIVEGNSIKTLINAGAVVISVGGGGIPVIRKPSGELTGVEAVIDKDLGGSVLADLIGADTFMILTDVECAYVDYRGPNKRALPKLTVAEAQTLFEANEFAKGSMGPKVQAAIKFAKTTGRPAIITALDKVLDALDGTAGTRVVSGL
ncbi:carbamate kinase [Pelomyxa schiedti]|nr:carbamate kinase [Pelomyxa schiedti]